MAGIVIRGGETLTVVAVRPLPDTTSLPFQGYCVHAGHDRR